MLHASTSARRRLRQLGIAPGILPPGPHNAITDVAGVLVGHETLIADPMVRTGVTAIVPHSGNLFEDRVPAGVAIGNGFGKFAGLTQVQELGELETPVLLTNTLSVAPVMQGTVDWTLDRNPQALSVNAVVGETNDGVVNDIRARVVTPAHAMRALDVARGGPVHEGCVGAGTGTVAFGWKGGVGTGSRVLPPALGGFTVGVLAQVNFGGVLQVAGLPIGQLMGQHYLRGELDQGDADGSVVFVIATDAPLSDRNLRRLAARSFLGMGRTGSAMTNGSGDYALAFSTAPSVRRTPDRRAAAWSPLELPNDLISPLFQAVIEATEEAILNALCMAVPMDTHDGRRIEALPLEVLVEAAAGNKPCGR
ncbi:P1 family peptidase [Deinococcus humi]|uniref:D-aminopeptidase n=1 Tax=Deinococcus humi TaxID=662880 RepID=A0A7W8JVY9_9DEIO|nr:P1 family peptidase [Deinococcus humi]MBB5362786.1 D-aminopeptidase [Deinococcus humi]GGO26246.1 D-aminopeptidase [Deinococcus humi]